VSARRPRLSAEFLQWFGLGGAALVWACNLVIGVGTSIARCGAGGTSYGIDLNTWVLATGAVALAFALSAEAAAIVVVRRTSDAAYDGPPPDGRRHFFALAAMVGNLLFVVAIVLSTVAVLTFDPCRQA
jgi:hypothetical protein